MIDALHVVVNTSFAERKPYVLETPTGKPDNAEEEIQHQNGEGDAEFIETEIRRNTLEITQMRARHFAIVGSSREETI